MLNLLGAAKAGTITVNANACIGSDLTFSVAGYVGTAFQWQSCPISTATAPGTFVDIPGATGTTYTATNMQLTSNRSYRVIVTNGPCGNTTSTSATKTITVNPLSVPGTITGGGTVCSGGLGSLKATGYVGKLQWEYSTDGVNYVNAPKAADGQTTPFATTSAGSTTSSYNITGIVSDVYFRLKVTSGACSSVYTSAVHYVIGSAATGGTVTPAESTICPGTGTTLSLSGAIGTVTWQKSTNWLSATPLWTATPNHTNTYATGNLTATTAFRAMVTTGTCSTVYSSLGVVNVVAKPLAKPIAKNTTTPSGATLATAMCTTDASKVLTMGTGYIGFIQWQVSTTSTTTGFTDIVGANTASYTITGPAVGANYYRVKLGSACGTEIYSTVVTQYYKDCSAKADDAELVNTVKAPFNVVAYPNPYNDSFNLSLTTSSEENVGVVIYDMLGKLVDQREVRPSDVAELHVGDSYPSGIYNVIITQGAEVKTLRVVKR